MIRTLLDIPLWEIADLDQPSGVGDKRILREVRASLKPFCPFSPTCLLMNTKASLYIRTKDLINNWSYGYICLSDIVNAVGEFCLLNVCELVSLSWKFCVN